MADKSTNINISKYLKEREKQIRKLTEKCEQKKLELAKEIAILETEIKSIDSSLYRTIDIMEKYIEKIKYNWSWITPDELKTLKVIVPTIVTADDEKYSNDDGKLVFHHFGNCPEILQFKDKFKSGLMDTDLYFSGLASGYEMMDTVFELHTEDIHDTDAMILFENHEYILGDKEISVGTLIYDNPDSDNCIEAMLKARVMYIQLA